MTHPLLTRAEKEAAPIYARLIASGLPQQVAAGLAAEAVVREGENVHRSRFLVFEALLCRLPDFEPIQVVVFEADDDALTFCCHQDVEDTPYGYELELT